MAVLLIQGRFYPLQAICNVWRHFWLTQWGREWETRDAAGHPAMHRTTSHRYLLAPPLTNYDLRQNNILADSLSKCSTH